jgi:hypothetical protein
MEVKKSRYDHPLGYAATAHTPPCLVGRVPYYALVSGLQANTEPRRPLAAQSPPAPTPWGPAGVDWLVIAMRPKTPRRTEMPVSARDPEEYWRGFAGRETTPRAFTPEARIQDRRQSIRCCRFARCCWHSSLPPLCHSGT